MDVQAKKQGKAVVMGGSMAGMLAARVLADEFEEVLIVDRDEFPAGPENRAGTPQAYHPHRLLPRGKMILSELFPGWMEELLTYGAFSREGKTIRSISPYGTLEVTDRQDAVCTRALLEWAFRRRIQVIPNIRLLAGWEVTGLQMTTDQSEVTGVLLRERGGERQSAAIEADLVVDASGRSSKLARWLQAAGYEVPEPERLATSLGYSTRLYRMPGHVADRWSVILVEGIPAQGRGTGVFGPIEGNKVEVVLYCAGGQRYPSTDAELYEQELAELYDPILAEVLQDCEPLGPPRGYRVPECFRQRFEQMERWPSGLLAVGDALCNFDPIYGQGITVAAIEAEILGRYLRGRGPGRSGGWEREVFEQMQVAIEPAWWLTTVSDLCWPGVTYTGAYSPEGIAFAQTYLDLYRKLAVGGRRMELFQKYMMVNGLLISPQEILSVEMIEAVLAADPTGEGKRWLAGLGLEEWARLQQFLKRNLPVFAGKGAIGRE
ncbi:FAD-dependent monooxygenase [Paenibacillus filicis]|uniref:FAD-dependent monooxygenase n=1 Tax=Paenibacillus filicis TaxID=669464 RepID=A0ABU9DJP3_9BACL